MRIVFHSRNNYARSISQCEWLIVRSAALTWFLFLVVIQLFVEWLTRGVQSSEIFSPEYFTSCPDSSFQLLNSFLAPFFTRTPVSPGVEMINESGDELRGNQKWPGAIPD
jgi:hypothetical protein